MGISKSVNQKTKTLSFSDQSQEGSCCGVAWRARVKGQFGSFGRVGMVLSAIEISRERETCVNVKTFGVYNSAKHNDALKLSCYRGVSYSYSLTAFH
jgi:hypothetical protein